MALRPHTRPLAVAALLVPVLVAACGGSGRDSKSSSPTLTPRTAAAEATGAGTTGTTPFQSTGTLPPASPDSVQPPALVPLPAVR